MYSNELIAGIIDSLSKSEEEVREIVKFLSEDSKNNWRRSLETGAQQYSPAENNVMSFFPQFRKDYKTLIEKGYMRKDGDFLKWEKGQKLLSEYFGSLTSKDNKRHWHEIENLFSEKNLAQAFQNSKNIKQSKLYEDLLKDLNL